MAEGYSNFGQLMLHPASPCLGKLSQPFQMMLQSTKSKQLRKIQIKLFSKFVRNHKFKKNMAELSQIELLFGKYNNYFRPFTVPEGIFD